MNTTQVLTGTSILIALLLLAIWVTLIVQPSAQDWYDVQARIMREQTQVMRDLLMSAGH